MAPDFELEATDGKTYRLSDFRGTSAVVLAWFPRAFTTGCTLECKSLAQNGNLIRQFDVTYFMASVDPLPENRRFGESLNADFPLLSDPTKAAARDYGVLYENRFALRQTFYIGKDGQILAIDTNVNPETAAEDIAATLGELNVSRASKDRGAEPGPPDRAR